MLYSFFFCSPFSQRISKKDDHHKTPTVTPTEVALTSGRTVGQGHAEVKFTRSLSGRNKKASSYISTKVHTTHCIYSHCLLLLSLSHHITLSDLIQFGLFSSVRVGVCIPFRSTLGFLVLVHLVNLLCLSFRWIVLYEFLFRITFLCVKFPL